jgi:hypothetical protein
MAIAQNPGKSAQMAQHSAGAVNKTASVKSIRGDHRGIIAGLEITAQQAANIVGVTPVTMGQLVKAGWIKPAESGLYEAVTFIRGWTAYKDELRKRARTKMGAASRIQEARALEIELRTARDAGELVELSAAIAFAQSIAGETRAVFGALPARFTRDLEMRAKLETMVNEGFNQIADKLEKEISALDGSDLLSADDDASLG